jgi:hypothetical protein
MKKLLPRIFILACCASLAFAGEPPLTKPEVFNEETIYLTHKISANYDTLLIKEFSADGVEYSNVNDEDKTKILQLVPSLKSNVTLSLEAALKTKKIFGSIVKNGPAAGKVLILGGSFSEFNSGSPTLKFFGAGKASIKFKGKLIDGATGKDLALFEDRETGFTETKPSDSFEDLFPHQAKSIGENMARFLEKLY